MKTYDKLISGFTLIELAVVLVIVGILLGSTLSSLSSRIEHTRKIDTIEELEEIKQAMMAFAFVNGYLPCPDCTTNAGGCNTVAAANIADGVEDYDAFNNRCSATDNLGNEILGNMPWVTLGFGRSDAWNTRYRYTVQNEYADLASPFTLASAGGSAIIQEPDFATDATGATARTLANNIVAVLLSHGPNGFGGTDENNIVRAAIPAANIDELENTDNDQFFYTRPETAAGATIAGGAFDDIVIWISEFELKAKMVEAGKLPL
jgi:prepilin-type N-terminal cleavage/methylation domain-containing protein